MDLVIGGAYQGKKIFAQEQFGLTDAEFADASVLHVEEAFSGRFALYDYQLRVRKQLQEGLQPEEELKKLITGYPDVCIIANETGSGLIPTERSERDYREAVGRTLCAAAKEAAEVWRVICGIGQRIK